MKILIAVWLSCGFLTYGIDNADMKWFEYNVVPGLHNGQRDELGIIVGMSAFGPMGLAAALITSNFAQHGITWKTWGPKQ